MKEIAGFAQAVVDRASALNGHSAEDWRTLASVRTVTTAWAPELAAIFGEVVYGAPALADLMSRHSRGDRESAIAIWFERVASGAPPVQASPKQDAVAARSVFASVQSRSW